MAQAAKEAVGIFKDTQQLDEAIAELEATAFPRQDISVMADEAEVKEKLDIKVIKTDMLQDNPETPRTISVRPEEKTIGATVMVGVIAYLFGCGALLYVSPAPGETVLAAVTGASLVGGLIGGLIAFLMRRGMKQKADRQIEQGGILLWVRTPGPGREKKAKEILKKHGADHVHIHNA